jgi:hypothetical protein
MGPAYLARARLTIFIDLCLLRRKPQDLPASPVLFGLVLVVAALAGVLLSVTAGAGAGRLRWRRVCWICC